MVKYKNLISFKFHYKRSNAPPEGGCGFSGGAFGAGNPPFPIGDNGLGDFDEDWDIFIAFIDIAAFF